MRLHVRCCDHPAGTSSTAMLMVLLPSSATPVRPQGQGDFVRVLLDAVQPELDKEAKDISQYTLQVWSWHAALGELFSISSGMAALLYANKQFLKTSRKPVHIDLQGVPEMRRGTWTPRCAPPAPRARTPTCCAAWMCACRTPVSSPVWLRFGPDLNVTQQSTSLAYWVLLH